MRRRVLGSHSSRSGPRDSQRIRRVRLRLDWNGGTLEFTNADTDTHLLKFRHRFTEKVYPYFESVSLCGGFTVLAQRVKVSVGSHVENAAIAEASRTMTSDSDINAAMNKSNGKTSSADVRLKTKTGRFLLRERRRKPNLRDEPQRKGKDNRQQTCCQTPEQQAQV